MTVFEKLYVIQTGLKVPKGQFNSFGKYKYRSCEDILEAVKPLLQATKCVLPISDEIKLIGDRYYIEATVTLIDCETGEKFSCSASAREEQDKKGMDASQVTGAASSYARKYALNGLLDIDDEKDADSTNKHGKDSEEEVAKPSFGKPTPVTSSPTKVSSKLINEAQRKRLYAISKGDTELIKSVVSSYGYESSKDIDTSQYEKICKAIEDLVATKEGK